MLHPTQTYTTGLASESAINPPITHNSQFYTYGRIIYRDIYERWWRTTYCYSHEGQNRFVPYGTYNKEDGDYKNREAALNASA